jgi:hypothetical protein
MDKCHRYVVALAPYLIKNKRAFMSNNKTEIENELRTILQKIDNIVYNTHDVKTLTTSIYDKDYPLSEVFREFYYIVMTYLTKDFCKKGDKDFANIFRTYLCEKGARNLTQLYHFIANIGIIKLGCTRIYLVDKTKRGQQVNIISDDEFLLQHVLNTSYRISKSEVQKCIRSHYKKAGISNLLIGRTLLYISKLFRSSVKDFCPIIYKNWSIQAKKQHEQFENWLDAFIHDVDDLIIELQK